MKQIKYLLVVTILLFLVGCNNEKNVDQNSDNSSFYFFYPDSQAKYWMCEEIKLENNLRVIIEELINSEKNKISSDVELIDYEVKNKVLYINLSGNFVDYDKGDLVRIVNCNTLVNTVCLNHIENYEIESVKFLLDGLEKNDLSREPPSTSPHKDENSSFYYPNTKLDTLN